MNRDESIDHTAKDILTLLTYEQYDDYKEILEQVKRRLLQLVKGELARRSPTG